MRAPAVCGLRLLGLVTLLALGVLLSSPVFAAGAGNASGASEELLSAGAAPPEGPVLQWTARDVERWMNNTIGYPEYSGYVRKHLIDGVTLLAMEAADFENFFPIENALHVIKIDAHVRALKGLCSCRADGDDGLGGSGSEDMWAHMRAHPVRVWGEGLTSLFFPRVAMAAVPVFDRPLYDALTRSTARSPTVTVRLETPEDTATATPATMPRSLARTAAYWVSFFIAPDLYCAYHCARLVGRNIFFFGFHVIYFVAQAVNEYMLLYLILKGRAFEPGTSLRQRFLAVFSYTLAFPPAGLVVGYVFPVFLQYVVVAALVVHSVLMLVGLAVTLLPSLFGGREDASEADVFHSSSNEHNNSNVSDANNANDGSEEDGGGKTEKLD